MYIYRQSSRPRVPVDDQLNNECILCCDSTVHPECHPRLWPRLRNSDLSRPPGGVITPQFSCDTPNHLKFKGSYQGGVYGGGGVYVIVMEGVKY